MRNAFVQAFSLGVWDEKFALLTGDLGYNLFDHGHHYRYINAGIAEANMIGMAAGLALEGFRPFVYSIIPFVSLRCLEQIRNDVAYNNLNVKIVGVGSGFSYGTNGPTHHALDDIALFRTMPNMTIVCPGDPEETHNATRALMEHKGPAYLRLGRDGEPFIHETGLNFKIGQNITLALGGDICIFSTGNMLSTAVEIGSQLQEMGIYTSAVSVHTIKPFNEEQFLKKANDKKLIISLEEHGAVGGLSSIITECLWRNKVNIDYLPFTTPDKYCNIVGDQQYLREQYGLSTEHIISKIKEKVKK